MPSNASATLRSGRLCVKTGNFMACTTAILLLFATDFAYADSSSNWFDAATNALKAAISGKQAVDSASDAAKSAQAAKDAVSGTPSNQRAPAQAAPPPSQSPGLLDRLPASWRDFLKIPGRSPEQPTQGSTGQSSEIVPTVIRPSPIMGQCPGNPKGTGQYVDDLGILSGATDQMINQSSNPVPDGVHLMTICDLAALRAKAPPEVMTLLDIAFLPNPAHVALIAREARQVAGPNADAELQAALRNLEAQGHALATAVRLHPEAATLVDDHIRGQREQLDALGFRAAYGDDPALDQLKDTSAKVLGAPAGPELAAVAHSLAIARHIARLKYRTFAGGRDTYWVLRTGSLEAALDHMAAVRSANAMTATVGCSIVTGTACGGSSPSGLPSNPYCPSVDRDGTWDALELGEYQRICVDPPPLKEKPRTRCLAPESVDAMKAIARRALRDPAFIDSQQAYLSSGGLEVTGFDFLGTDSDAPNPAGVPFNCTMLLKPVFTRPEGHEQDSGMGMGGVLQVGKTIEIFHADPGPDGTWTFRLRHLMGVQLTEEFNQVTHQ